MWTRRDFMGAMGLAGAAMLGGCAVGSETAARTGTTGNTAPDGSGIDRRAVVERHAPVVTKIDPQAVFSLGNGQLAFNVDATGLQTLNDAYTAIPLCTMAHWGWHSFPVPGGVDLTKVRYKMFNTYGREVPYATDQNGQPNKYLRENPHKFHLGRIGLVAKGEAIAAHRVTGIEQKLDLWRGVVESSFLLDGMPVKVTTCVHPEQDVVAVRVECAKAGGGVEMGLAVRLAFPYGSEGMSAADWTTQSAAKHQSTVLMNEGGLTRIARQMDDAKYWVRMRLSDAMAADLRNPALHVYDVRMAKPALLEMSVAFDRAEQLGPVPTFGETLAASEKHWAAFWGSGAAIDFAACTDEWAPELERRVVLSQYLTAIHCAGEWPSAETGLLCNSWYGKFHLEMHFWHSAHFTMWGRPELFERSLGFYEKALESSKARARQQGYPGARWPKMTSPDFADSPSSVGVLLIWQQPHPIMYAWLCYRAKPTPETIQRWKVIVRETADFMAGFAHDEGSRFVLGPPMKTVSENADANTTIDPTWELTSWRFGLMTAMWWMEKAGEKANPKWGAVLAKLAKPTVRDGVYLMQENMPDTYTKMNYEHPALCGALGVLRGDGIDPAVMQATVRKVHDVWQWDRVWGWDFPVMAMCAARSGLPDLAVEMLLKKSTMNGYLANGGNFQRPNLPAYYPGNGGLLLATGMMAGGWGDGGTRRGFPQGGGWNVRTEGFGRWV
ncbi:MAG TPA: twin-arginine translocation signal domain-containing protein [Phycisphaerae bacterium]|nr:twin-arginine translocation signal domain-containing protein [Phycisphaerae bacterium]